MLCSSNTFDNRNITQYLKKGCRQEYASLLSRHFSLNLEFKDLCPFATHVTTSLLTSLNMVAQV